MGRFHKSYERRRVATLEDAAVAQHEERRGLNEADGEERDEEARFADFVPRDQHAEEEARRAAREREDEERALPDPSFSEAGASLVDEAGEEREEACEGRVGEEDGVDRGLGPAGPTSRRPLRLWMGPARINGGLRRAGGWRRAP